MSNGVGKTGSINETRNAAGDFSRTGETRSLVKRMSKSPESSTVLQRVARSDRAAVQDCLDAHGALVWAMAKKFTSSREEAETFTQEIFLEIWKCAARFDPAKCGETDFIASLALRQLIRRARERLSLSASAK